MSGGDENELMVEVEVDGVEEIAANPTTALTLVGRFLSDRPIRAHIMKERMAGVWRPGRGVNIRELGDGIFLFQFFHLLDLEKVLKQGPWSFDKHLLILNTIPEGMSPSEVPLFQIPFWVQVHNVPVGFMSETVGRHVGNTVGSFVEYDAKNTSDFWRIFMRVRVLLDVRKPLLKKLKLRKPGGEAKEVLLKYERLEIFCYLCGMLGHMEGVCDKRFDMTHDDGVRHWGPEIKAEMRRGGGSGGARWLREEGQEWIAPTTVRQPAHTVHGNQDHSLRHSSASQSTSKTVSNNSTVNGIDNLVEIFKNPAILFPNKTTPTGTSATAMSDVEMEPEVAVHLDRKRMREGEVSEASADKGAGGSGGDTDNNNTTVHFLKVGPSSGACQEQ